MPERDDLDDMLRSYLQREQEDPIRRRLEALTNWQTAHDQKDDQRHAEVMRHLDGHNYRISGLEQKAEKLEDEVEDTQNHRIADLQKKAGRTDDLIWKVVTGVLLVAGGIETALRLSGH